MVSQQTQRQRVVEQTVGIEQCEDAGRLHTSGGLETGGQGPGAFAVGSPARSEGPAPTRLAAIPRYALDDFEGAIFLEALQDDELPASLQ